MTWIKAALGLIALVNWVMSRLDETEKAQALAALWEAEFMKADKKAIEDAQNARGALERELADRPGSLRDPDRDSRT